MGLLKRISSVGRKSKSEKKSIAIQQQVAEEIAETPTYRLPSGLWVAGC